MSTAGKLVKPVHTATHFLCSSAMIEAAYWLVAVGRQGRGRIQTASFVSTRRYLIDGTTILVAVLRGKISHLGRPAGCPSVRSVCIKIALEPGGRCTAPAHRVAFVVVQAILEASHDLPRVVRSPIAPIGEEQALARGRAGPS